MSRHPDRPRLTEVEAGELAATFPHEFRAGIARRLAAGDRSTEVRVLCEQRKQVTAEEKEALRRQRRSIVETSAAAERECYHNGVAIDPARLHSLKTSCQQDLWQADREMLRLLAQRLAAARRVK